jgi:hypothetical protein
LQNFPSFTKQAAGVPVAIGDGQNNAQFVCYGHCIGCLAVGTVRVLFILMMVVGGIGFLTMLALALAP